MDHRDDGEMCGGRGLGISPVVAALEAAGLYPIQEYIKRRR